MKQILFVHQNFPGQYRYLARHFAANPDWQVFAIGERDNVKRQAASLPADQMTLLGYDKPPASNPQTLGLAQEFESHLHRAQLVASLALRQQKKGLNPDIVLSHPGWGDSLYLREVFPKARFLSFFEYYFEPDGELVNFDVGDTLSLAERMSFRSKNATNLLALEMADLGVCPTEWQWSTFPASYRDKIRVIHDGVDTDMASPAPGVSINISGLSDGPRKLTADDEIITYSVRNLEPHRGFHVFMRALPELQRRRPNAITLIIGGDEVSYGKKPGSGKTWRQELMEEVGGELDMSRVAFIGKVPYATLLNIYRITSLRIYLTSPFVLSWSLLEGMACGTPVLASATAPVAEVIEDGINGVLFDFHNIEALVGKAVELLADEAGRRRLGLGARASIVERYDLKRRCLPQQLTLVEELLS